MMNKPMKARNGERWPAAPLFFVLSISTSAWGQVPVGSASVSGGLIEPIRSAYLQGRYQEAVLLVDRTLSEKSPLPGIASELHFWRGAALRRLGRLDEALVAFDVARKGRFKAPELALERALALRALGREQEAEREYQEADRLLEKEPERRLKFSEEWRQAHKKEADFRLTITPQIGYDSNIVGLDKDAPLEVGDLERDSFYYGAVLAAKYYLLKNYERVLAFEARSQERNYADEPDLGYTDNTLSVLGRYPLADAFAFEVRGSLGEAYVRGEGHARTVRQAGPALIWFPDLTWQVRLFADWVDTDYYDADVPSDQDRDGVFQRIGLTVGIDLGGGWSVGPMAAWGRTSADGDDFDSRDSTLGVALTTGNLLGFVISTTVGYTLSDYANPNSLTAFEKQREDRILWVTFTVTIRKLEEWIGYAPALAVTFIDHRSNVDDYDYDRWEPRVELGIAALTF